MKNQICLNSIFLFSFQLMNKLAILRRFAVVCERVKVYYFLQTLRFLRFNNINRDYDGYKQVSVIYFLKTNLKLCNHL